jgi:hypothetical protein
MLADIPLFLEHGVTKGILSYPEYYEIMSLVKLNEKRSVLPKFTNVSEHLRLGGAIDKKYNYYHDNLML